ncbi:MAG: type II secretion system protein GspC [Candidatus Thiodiazotropha sp. (ex Lucinoma aequizonata)]|nr:type II secretion system protein GspC [Candidatus Thiodiazotropha sp. (ex Lucinoma aequizonata)]MCU7893917.1 type II secretion system protein GspC [Candidatus Thiodiazotropha sp. (ex Lucinoma aequizonata)]MCU7898568.1 type II secretion system protein GspC [Candidatus Thiodiazotropha sp. (ex Lucinoma aequizonata)]MCU7901667.1 type II secretion system protein GspC [Candidatus Thiodiazotropha sp. (ex Lucinoma aequizonata)]
MNIAAQAQDYLNDWMVEKLTPKWLEKLLSRQLPLPVALLLLLLIGWRMADLTWRLIPEPEIQQQARSLNVSKSTSGNRDPASTNQLEKVAKLHLFGIAGATKPRKAIDKKALETRLNLTLHGVFVFAESNKGEAIIGTSGLVQKYYKVGSAVMSGVILQAVFEDRVVLLRNGQSELLHFFKISNESSPFVSRTTRKSKSTVATGPNVPPVSRRNLSRYREMLRKEPLKIFEHVRFVPARSREAIVSYRKRTGSSTISWVCVLPIC